MKIIVPMSGMGNRFVEAGYQIPKPLIKIDGRPIIEHIVNMFSDEDDFIFICNSKHLKETQMRSVLEKIAPRGTIVEIAGHKKGPVFAVQQIQELIRDEEEVIINYCDFSCFWDYKDFLKHTRARNADGAVPSYKGFHPHMLGSTNYAFMRDNEQWMLEIKEKEPFTDNRMEEYASMGTYYFKKGAYVKEYFAVLINRDVNLNGEYYVSLVYNILVENGLKVSIYNVQHMLQWGTPQDVEEYNGFSNYFRALSLKSSKDKILEDNSINLIPLAGKGSRFASVGYKDPKPLIKVGGKAMIIQAADALPKASNNIFICIEDHLSKYPLESVIDDAFKNNKIISINTTTEGQACTCEIGLEKEDLSSSLLIAACDNGMLWSYEKYASLIYDDEVDVIVWTFRNHPSSSRNPEMYGWVRTSGEDAVGVSVKTSY